MRMKNTEFNFTEESTPFSLTYLGKEIFFDVPADKEKEIEPLFPEIVRKYNWLKLRAVEIPINPIELEFILDEPYPYKDLYAQSERETLIDIFLVLKAIQPAKIMLAGGEVKIEIGEHERKAAFFLEHPPTDIHKKAVEEFLIKYRPELLRLLE